MKIVYKKRKVYDKYDIIIGNYKRAGFRVEENNGAISFSRPAPEIKLDYFTNPFSKSCGGLYSVGNGKWDYINPDFVKSLPKMTPVSESERKR